MALAAFLLLCASLAAGELDVGPSAHIAGDNVYAVAIGICSYIEGGEPHEYCIDGVWTPPPPTLYETYVMPLVKWFQHQRSLFGTIALASIAIWALTIAQRHLPGEVDKDTVMCCIMLLLLAVATLCTGMLTALTLVRLST